jgi:uncharacterized damage-inducible protein DinB
MKKSNSPSVLKETFMQRRLTAFCCMLLAAGVVRVAAQTNPYKNGTPGVTGYRSEVLSEVIVQEDKFVRLAEAIPADKYTWRPAPDVRSFAEVFLHVTGANYNLYTMVGSKIPDGINTKDIGKSTTDKTKIVAMLKDSFAHAQAAIKAMPDADLERSMDWFGGKLTERGVLLFIVRHGAEHLGQSIAYARVSGITPPWTADAEKAKGTKN